MNIHDWNKFLWEVVEHRLNRPGSRLFLAFEDNLLEDEARRAGREIGSDSPSSELNRVIQEHCQMLTSGVVGLAARPGGMLGRNNWQWALVDQREGRTLALVFAAHQVLAAEHMRGASFYSAYWHALGVHADEMRINPFGDYGRYSFEKMWRVLRRELIESLGIDSGAITFTQGRGSNKYRNLPVSQSLLSEKDLQAARNSVRRAESLGDERLYAALRNVRLSRSGRRKVFNRALREFLIVQFREFLKMDIGVAGNTSEPSKPKTMGPVLEGRLTLYEEFEFFSDEVFHCALTNPMDSLDSILAEFVDDGRPIVFGGSESGVLSQKGLVLNEQGSQYFILGSNHQILDLLERRIPVGQGPLLGEYFAEVSAVLPNGYALIRCISLPNFLAGLDLSGAEITIVSSAANARVVLVGGLCVNRNSNSFVLGFGPTGLAIGGEIVAGTQVCALDETEMAVSDALKNLSGAITPSKFLLRILEREVFIDMVGPRSREIQPSFVRSDFCVLPRSVLTFKSDQIPETDAPFALLEQALSKAWFSRKGTLRKYIDHSFFSEPTTWMRVDARTARSIAVLLSYSELPSGSKQPIEQKMHQTQTVPWLIGSGRWRAIC